MRCVGHVSNWQTEADMKATEKVAEIIVAKQRHGSCGSLRLFNDQSMRKFGNLVNKEDGF